MKLWFCETCGKRVTDKDIREGAAKDKQVRGVYRENCAAGVHTMTFESLRAPGDTPPPASVAAAKPALGRITPPKPVSAKPPSGILIPLARPGLQSHNVSVVTTPRGTPSGRGREAKEFQRTTPMLLAGIALLAAIVFGVLIVGAHATSSKFGAELSDAKSVNNTKLPQAVTITPPVPASLPTPVAGVVPPTVSAGSTVSAQPEAPKALTADDDPRESFAQRNLDATLEQFKKSPGDTSAYTAALEELASKYGHTAAGMRAAELRAAFKAPEPPASVSVSNAMPVTALVDDQPATPAPGAVASAPVAGNAPPNGTAPVAPSIPVPVPAVPRAHVAAAVAESASKVDTRPFYLFEAESGKWGLGWSCNERPGFSGGKVVEIYLDTDPDSKGFWAECKITAPADGRYEILISGANFKYTSAFTWQIDGGALFPFDREFPMVQDVLGIKNAMPIVGIQYLKKGDHTFRLKLAKRRVVPDHFWSLWFDAVILRPAK